MTALGRRVLHVMQSAHIGGAERHLLQLLPGLRKAGWDVRFFGFTILDHSRFAEALSKTGVPVSLMRTKRLFSPAVMRGIRREIASVDPSIVHTHLFYADIQGQLGTLLTGVRSVRTIHSSTMLRSRGRERLASAIAGRIADRTLAISRHIADSSRARGLAPADRIRLVHYGIDPEFWAGEDSQRAEARRMLGFETDDIVVACTSRIVEHKGQDHLIEAVARARQLVPSLGLVLAGGGEFRDRTETLADQLLPSVAYRFLGPVADVRQVLWGSDILAFPTKPALGEAFGLAALEAMAARLPVIASDLPSLREIVIPGVTGELLEPSDVDAWAASIVRLARDPALRYRMAGASANRVRSDFTLAAMVKRTIGVYNELVD